MLTLFIPLGVISVVDELDYEQQSQYELLVRATDSVSGVYAEVPVSIGLQDVNDCPPEFSQASYNISITEASQIGTSILTVIAYDNDTGVNQQMIYSIEKDSSNATDYFYIDENDGTVYLKQSLDHEEMHSHHFVVVATDKGVPSLSSTAHVWLSGKYWIFLQNLAPYIILFFYLVIDMNDNPPKFEQMSYSCGVSVSAKRDQFVTMVQASDLDEIDQNSLRYSIVGGNDQQIYSMDSTTGLITLTNLANFGHERIMSLNISVSDGVYTSFARLKVELLPANLHPPSFLDIVKDVQVPENRMAGHLVAIVNATDQDMGEFGTITYSIHSDALSEVFDIGKSSGKITTKTRLDREKQKTYEILVCATDGGGLSDFLNVRVKVIDENDNPPKFLLKEYKISIHSNLTGGTSFAKIRATDADDGKNAEIEYSIYEKKSSEVVSIFGIDPKSGDLFLLKNAFSSGKFFLYLLKSIYKHIYF